MSGGVDDISVKPSWAGSLTSHITTNSWHIPNGASLHISLSPTFTTSITVSAAVTCGISIGDPVQIAIGPVPVVIDPSIGVSFSFKGSGTVTQKVTLGAYGDASLAGGHLAVSGGKIFTPQSATTSVETETSVQVEASILVGPGVALGKGAGAVLGLKIDDTLANSATPKTKPPPPAGPSTSPQASTPASPPKSGSDHSPTRSTKRSTTTTNPGTATPNRSANAAAEAAAEAAEAAEAAAGAAVILR